MSTALSASASRAAPNGQSRGRIERMSLPGAQNGRLIFAQVREDPRVELWALHPGPGERAVVVSSGGCTALSLLAAGAGEIHAVDVSRTQNHLVELKAAAVARLDRNLAIRFLGGAPLTARERLALYGALRAMLTPDARAYWDGRRDAIADGVLEAGVSERFIRLVCWTVRHLVQSPDRIARLLACKSLDEQRTLFTSEWDGRRWRWLFAVLLNRYAMSRAYDPRFFAHVGRTNFAEHFLQLANRAITEVPVADNYFLHQMLSGRYPTARTEGVPPYLAEPAFASRTRATGLLRLVDGGITEYLRTLPAGSIHAFALSNVCEWMSPEQIPVLFGEVERTAAPGARVVFRNFVGWTDLPKSCVRLEEDHALGTQLMLRERSVVQSRVVVCRVPEAA
jgi:S-adenosylmethionine-diacylglycerol 3-amino-3-carboxypropyl transferase